MNTNEKDLEEEFLEVFPVSGGTAPCWPDVDAEQYVAIPVSLQGVHMGVLCLVERAGSDPLKTEEKPLLGLLVKKLDTLLDNRAVHAALAESMRETLIALVRSLEARDRYTKDHSSRVSQLSVLIAQEMGVDDETGQLIRTGGLLHDIGKVGIADQVLLKPGRYTDNEYAIMKAHPAIGDAILKNMDALVRERLMVRHHHERWDGHGYPDRLGEEDIPFEARIVCVADAIDAMTTHRVYRMARPLSFCVEQLKQNSGTQFDSQVVEAAVSAIERGVVQTQAKVGEYEHEGLILPYKTNGGTRMYSLHDLERLHCIREMITKHGLNLNGINQLMSMIPCWEYKGGLDKQCQNCPVYYEAKGPCWTRGDVGPKCQEVDCRECPVYRIELNCAKLKEVIFGHKAPGS